eukprot:TRINITY_DN5157_c2_g1_i1.p1 TRINITY_DN5157_c2_g1~~TRINITY_DN5157_c2_g1_i1.p1  ORF type:complete len:131 (+),score=19.17 TRINITY_DN5157_c2_g1_i1:1229-1621(+)
MLDLFGKGRFCGTSLLVLELGWSILLWTLEVSFILDHGGQFHFGPWRSVSFWTLVVNCILGLSGRFHFGPWRSVSFWTLEVGFILDLSGQLHFGPQWSVSFWTFMVDFVLGQKRMILRCPGMRFGNSLYM